ncbi:MAG: DUF5717 family protein [Lachnospiraceae bacterium]|nr:DUF5717 family protein [Lachnospiraceae bacterium]
MEEAVKRYLEDAPEAEREGIALSSEHLFLTIDPGETAEASFVVTSLDDRPAEGFVTVDEPRFRVLTPGFFGVNEEVGFQVRTDGLQGGDRVEASFSIISDAGEAYLPVTVSVRTPWPIIRNETGEEEIKNLFHFANLARQSFREAVRLFYSDGMLQLFGGADKKYLSIYRGLSGTDEGAADAAASVEEFLIAIRKKDPIEYTSDRTDLILDAVTEDVEETVRVSRRGWGFTRLFISTDGDFLEITRDVLADRDFLGNTCNLPVVIRYERLHAGKNFGRIILKNPYTKLTVDVVVTRGDEIRAAVRDEAKQKQILEAELIRTYVDYRLDRMKSREWLLATGQIISRMNALAPDDVRMQLYTAHYLITASRESEAVWVLDRIRTSVEETCSYGETMRAYFLYLETLLSREDTKICAVEEILLGMLARNPDNWRIAWLLQFLFDDRATGNSRRMRLYEEQFHYGCRSPILYIETLDLMGRDPSLLKKIDEFTLYVLSFAAKYNAIPKTLIDRAVWLIMKEKQGNRRIYRILAACYEEDHESGAIDAVCSLLIKDARTDEEAFAWYRRGVEADSRITRLYEYFMSAFPAPLAGEEVAEIPRQVLLYLSYRSDLPFDKNALLYRYVIAHREEEPDLYQAYVPQMERFVAEQMAKGRIDRSLSILYAHFCVLQPQDPVSAERFFEALHMTEFAVDDPDVRRVVVIYDRLRAERVFPVSNGKARFPVYGSEAAILYEDGDGHRYVHVRRGRDLGGRRERDLSAGLFDGNPDAALYSQVLPLLREGNANINLYLTEADRLSITADNVDRYRRLAESDALTRKSRNEISGALIRFYYDNDFVRQLADYLPSSRPEHMSVRERSEVMEMAVLSGIYDHAVAMTGRFGFTGLDSKTIVRLCSRAIARGDFPENDTALMLTWAAFRTGKYDEGILRYLAGHFRGLMKDEQAIARACASFSVEAPSLTARIAGQLLFTGARDAEEEKLFKELVKSGGSGELQMAWLARSSRDDLFGGRRLCRAMEQRITTLALSGESLPRSCRLAWLKYHADKDAPEGDPQVCAGFLELLEEKELSLPFLAAYRDRIPTLALTDGMRYIRIAGKPGAVFTAYLQKNDQYVPKRMQEPYPGFYTCGEVLFPGDSIRYFITGQTDGRERLCASGILNRDLSEDAEEGDYLYALTSRLVMAKTQNDRAAVKDILYTIYKNEFLSGKLFPLPEK